MGLLLKKQLTSAIDLFVAEKLAQAPTGKETLVSYVLEKTKKQVLAVIDSTIETGSGIEKLDDLCQALDAGSVTYIPSVLEAAGVPNLAQEILEYRIEVKWQILVQELRSSLPEGETFTPETIQRLNKPLYQALRAALKQENAEGDWENLRPKLPPELKNRFEAKKLSKKERRQQIDEDTKKSIEALGLSDIIAGLGKDPKKLTYFLQFTGELTEEQIDRIAYVSFTGLREARIESKLNRLLSQYQQKLGDVEILNKIPQTTQTNHVTFKIRVPEGMDRLLVRGPWQRDIKINGDREITFDVILQAGEENRIQLLAYNDDKKVRSSLQELTIQQTSEAADVDTLIVFLEALKEDTLRTIACDESKKNLFRKCLEESTIRHFAGNFETGRAYIAKLIKKQKNQFVIKTLQAIVKLFERINEMKFSFIRNGEDLMFFQKYCIYKIQEKRAAGDKGVILANEPGLGKTLNALALVHDDEPLIVCPNSAASTWTEQEGRFFQEPFLLPLANRPHAERLKLLRDRRERGVVTNVEFVRHKDEEEEASTGKPKINEKINLLNQRKYPKRKRVVVVDEAHFLKNDSQQTEGIARLESDFMLLLTASPYRTSSALCRVMAKIFPGDARFQSAAAFEAAFPMSDPQALKALHAMVRSHVVRFLKDEVMQTYDRSLPLDKQPLSLPAKKHIDPFETGTGLFELTPAQEQAILEMFQDWQGWTAKYDRYMPSGDAARLDGIRASDDRLTKEHALRQIVNNPAYINSNEDSPKHKAAMEILKREIAGGNKVVIFCRYHDQINAYAKLLKKLGIDFATYSGEVTKEGNKKGDEGRDIIFAVDEFGNYILENGEPVPAQGKQKGRPMLAIDYERLVFQNNPQKKVILATYSAGAQSVTFTAGNAIIFDDLPKDYIEKYQAEDRIHRIDEKRPKYDVRYYSLVSKYSEKFLTRARKIKVEKNGAGDSEQKITAYDKWFRQGTLDQVHYANLAAQRTAFELLNNGISVDPDLVEEEQAFVM